MTRIIQLADVHFGREDPTAIRAFENVLPDLGAEGIVVCGDLTQNGKRSEFDAAEAWLDQLGLPYFTVAGNHDTPMYNLVTRMVSPFARFLRSFGDRMPYAMLGGFRIHGLNTSRGWQIRSNWAEGSVDLEDLADIVEHDREQASQNTASRLGCLICHHPFRSPPSAPLQTRTRRGRRASEMLAQSTINLLLCGHVHTPTTNIWETDAGRYLCLTAGTLSTRLREWPTSFNRIEVADGQLTVVQYNLEGEEFVGKLHGRWSAETLEPLSI